MTTKERRKNRLPPFIPLFRSLMAMPAWRAMSPIGRLINIELRGHLRNDWLNNGKVHLSCRAGAKAIGINKDSVAQGLAENEHYGFLRKTAEGFLGANGYGIATKYRFTDLPHGTYPPTRDFEKWDGEMFAYTPRRPGRKKQNPVRSHRTPCPVPPDIETAPECPVKPDISRRTSLRAKRRVKQGSSTARAPVQAGDAGSSPAPVTKKPWSTPQVEELQA
jgi:hypothetical protein